MSGSDSAVEVRLRAIEDQCIDGIVCSLYLVHDNCADMGVEQYNTTMSEFVEALRNDAEARTAQLDRYEFRRRDNKDWPAAPLMRVMSAMVSERAVARPILQTHFDDDMLAAKRALKTLAATPGLATPPHHNVVYCMGEIVRHLAWQCNNPDRRGVPARYDTELMETFIAMLDWQCPVLERHSNAIVRHQRALPARALLSSLADLVERAHHVPLANALHDRDDVSRIVRTRARFVIGYTADANAAARRTEARRRQRIRAHDRYVERKADADAAALSRCSHVLFSEQWQLGGQRKRARHG